VRQVAFDTLKFVEKLIVSGMPEKQAKAQVEALGDVMQINLDGLSSKTDLQSTESRLELKIENIRHELKETEIRLEAKIENVRHELKETETRLESKIAHAQYTLDTKIDYVHHELNAKLDKSNTELHGKFTLLYWILSFLLAGMAAIVNKLYL
jgi:hypothetical protein